MSQQGENSLNVQVTQRNSKVSCCVVSCNNAYYNTDVNVKFYNFPNKWYEKERKEIWINSIRRIRSRGMEQPWKPKCRDKICSLHFVGNEKSNDPKNPAYNPTIFPKSYIKTSSSSGISRTDRYKRLLNRSATKQSQQCPISTASQVQISNENECMLPKEVDVSKQDFCCQTDVVDSEVADSSLLFESNFVNGSCEVATQCHIPLGEIKNLFTQKKDQCVGNDDVIECNGFHGFKSLKTDQELNCPAGVTLDRFALLLSFLINVHKNSKLTTENRLLLFLIKMKLGLSFSAFGVVIQLHHTTCCRIFLSVLEELVQKTKNFIFWPSRAIIDMTMPKAFKIHFAKCRAIIDYTELKIHQPKKVDQRIFTYSKYKSAFTVKIFIAITPTGFISFVSKCYGGRSTDTFITNDCGFLELLEPNDVILVHKRFPGIKCKDDVVLVLPPFVHEGRLSYEEVEETYTIASVERSIQRIKTYNILNKIPYNLFQYLDDIVQMCCVLTNLQPPTIKDCDDDDI